MKRSENDKNQMFQVSPEEFELINKVKFITSEKKHDAEVRVKKDGSWAVYEIRKHAV